MTDKVGKAKEVTIPKWLENLKAKIATLEGERLNLLKEIEELRKMAESKVKELEEEVKSLRKEVESLRELLQLS